MFIAQKLEVIRSGLAAPTCRAGMEQRRQFAQQEILPKRSREGGVSWRVLAHVNVLSDDEFERYGDGQVL